MQFIKTPLFLIATPYDTINLVHIGCGCYGGKEKNCSKEILNHIENYRLKFLKEINDYLKYNP